VTDVLSERRDSPRLGSQTWKEGEHYILKDERKFKVTIEVSNCFQCPFLRELGDICWECGKAERRVIMLKGEFYSRGLEYLPIPDWCPLLERKE